jgi:SAM-dependent methyltransferase
LNAGARYDAIGTTYAQHRRPDARIAALIAAAVGADAASIVDVGSGTGSYSPSSPGLVAVEPSWTMLQQRPVGAAPVARGVAEALPFASGRFDVALAVLTHHHWTDVDAGFAELRRVARRQVVLTWDPALIARYWLVAEYLPEIAEQEKDLACLAAAVDRLERPEVRPVPVPGDCVDGFAAAYWCRPEAYLDPSIRQAISSFALAAPAAVDRAVASLGDDLASGAWDDRHGSLRSLASLDVGYRIVVGGA